MNESFVNMEKPVIKVQREPVIEDFFPDYFFKFQNEVIDYKSTEEYEDYLEFLRTNQDLILTSPGITREYLEGFKLAVALLKLWIDSTYIK